MEEWLIFFLKKFCLSKHGLKRKEKKDKYILHPSTIRDLTHYIYLPTINLIHFTPLVKFFGSTTIMSLTHFAYVDSIVIILGVKKIYQFLFNLTKVTKYLKLVDEVEE